ncbi:TonB-dependent receptor [Sphingobacterium thalpophilum]|uniref:TonB-dependent receptor n=1 Tax=Sphingobacterium thalpophilum TaxID=259 RepID=A0ACD5C661_9SPHI
MITPMTKTVGKGLLLFSLMSMSAPAVLAQSQIKISGKVSSSTSEPLAGVTVQIKGVKNGTVTDGAGNYQILARDIDVLIFSLVGKEKTEVQVDKKDHINLVLQESSSLIDEVVVVGYGTQKKSNLTGAVAAVDGKVLNKRIATNPTQLLQGRMPGLRVTQGSGEAGNENVNLQVRGLGSYGASSAPLVIVDGIPGSLENLNPQAIENITVLKDAASAAIYGARAANGVILVTTKQGKAGKTQLSYDYNVGITKASALPDLVYNSVDYMTLYNQANKNSGVTNPNASFSQEMIDAYKNAIDKRLYPDFNWLDAVFRTVPVQTHNLSLSGGAGGTNYNVILGYVNQLDIMIGTSFKKYNLQLNLGSKINDRISFGSSITLNYGDRKYPRNGSEDQFLSTISQSPLYGPVLPDGSGRYTSRAYPFQSPNKNPVAVAENAFTRLNNYFMQGNIFLNVKILDGLDWKTSGGLTYGFTKNYTNKPVINQYMWFAKPDDLPARQLDVGGQGLEVTDDNNVYPVGYTQLTYDKSFGNHNMKVLAGTQAEYNKTQKLFGSRLQFPNNDLLELDGGGAGQQSNNGVTNEWSLRSYYGRLNYDYKGKYLLEGNARYDASSRFPENRKWAFFPSLSGGWKVSDENFFGPKLKEVVNELKLRASIGTLGNQNIGNYPYQIVYNSSFAYPFDETLQQGARQVAMANDRIKWESTKVLDFGVDIGLWNNKLTASFDWYNKVTSDILSASTAFPSYIGLTAPTVNYGELRNRGIELGLQYRDKIGAVSLTLNGNIQANRNKVMKYGAERISNNTIIREGLPYGSFYLLENTGIFRSKEEVAASPVQQIPAQPGYLKFADVNGDKVVDNNDRIVVPGAYPDFDYSFNATAVWKNFDFTAFFFGSQGQKIFVSEWGIVPFRQGGTFTRDCMNAWTPENPNASLPIVGAENTPAANNVRTASTFFLKDGSFLRLKNIQVGYAIPQSTLSKAGISGLRIYFAADNLLTFSKFPGLDPERGVSSSGGATSGRYVTHPQNKVFAFGASITF